MVPKVMRVYHMAYRETMNLPMRVFWHLHACIERLLAEERRDAYEVAARSGNSEALHEAILDLDKIAPPAVKPTVEAVIEASSAATPGGIDLLRSMT